MKRISMYAILAALMAVAFATRAEADAPATQPKLDAAAEAKEIAPFVNDTTFVVLHIDLASIDLDALKKFSDSMVDSNATMDDATKTQTKQQTADMISQHKEWFENFKKAGATELFLISNADPNNVDLVNGKFVATPAIITPLQPGADSDAIAKLLMNFPGQQADTSADDNKLTTKTVRNCVVLAHAKDLDALEKSTPSTQPVLQDALTSINQTTIQLVLIPTDAVRNSVSGIPVQPGSPDFSGLLNKSKWIALGGDLPPNTDVKLVYQAADSDTATSLLAVITQSLTTVANFVPQDIVTLITPIVNNNQLSLTLTGDQISKIVSAAMTAANNLKEIH